jgi:hypothetical protein
MEGRLAARALLDSASAERASFRVVIVTREFLYQTSVLIQGCMQSKGKMARLPSGNDNEKQRGSTSVGGDKQEAEIRPGKQQTWEKVRTEARQWEGPEGEQF